MHKAKHKRKHNASSYLRRFSSQIGRMKNCKNFLNTGTKHDRNDKVIFCFCVAILSIKFICSTDRHGSCVEFLAKNECPLATVSCNKPNKMYIIEKCHFTNEKKKCWLAASMRGRKSPTEGQRARVWVCEKNRAVWAHFHVVNGFFFNKYSFSVASRKRLWQQPETEPDNISVGAYLSTLAVLSIASLVHIETSSYCVLSSAAKVSVCAFGNCESNGYHFIHIDSHQNLCYFSFAFIGGRTKRISLHAFNSIRVGKIECVYVCIKISSLPQKKIDLHSSFMQR